MSPHFHKEPLLEGFINVYVGGRLKNSTEAITLMPERTHWWAIVLMLATTALTATAQVLFKAAAGRLPEIVTNWQLLVGMFLYVIGAAFLTASLKGGEVSVLYPLLATSYLWVTLASYFVYGESIGAMKIIGVLVVMIGVSIMGFASRDTSAVVMTEVP